MSTWSKKSLSALLIELEEDLKAYKGALDFIQLRKIDIGDTPHKELFNDSSGCQAVQHVLIMNIAATEGLIQDVRNSRNRLEEEER